MKHAFMHHDLVQLILSRYILVIFALMSVITTVFPHLGCSVLNWTSSPVLSKECTEHHFF